MQFKPDTSLPESDPLRHTAHIRAMLVEIIAHARADVGKVDEPQAKAIFEMTAEVLLGVRKTYEDYEKRMERAFASGRS
ncbi:MAG: hypothetical protein AABZ53_13560 [Planctomycetota bacterium]